MNTQIKRLKKGDEINHPTEGYLQYVGQATKHPYTKELKMPITYVFWRPIDDDGNIQPEYTTTNGGVEVEVIN